MAHILGGICCIYLGVYYDNRSVREKWRGYSTQVEGCKLDCMIVVPWHPILWGQKKKNQTIHTIYYKIQFDSIVNTYWMFKTNGIFLSVKKVLSHAVM